MFRAELEKAFAGRTEALIRQLESPKSAVKAGILKGSTAPSGPGTIRIPRRLMAEIRRESRLRASGRDTRDLRARLTESIRDRKNWSRREPRITIRRRGKPGGQIPVAQYAFWNEFGTRRTPPRPFMRNTFRNEAYRRGWKELIARGILSGMSLDDVLNLLGHQMHIDMIKTIRAAASWAAPNAPLTVAVKKAKGRAKPDQPLVDEGNLIKSIWYEVIQ